MEELAYKKKEIDEKLNKEVSRLNTLKEALGHSNQMTQNMMGILNTFDTRLKRLEETIMPVYQESGQLQRRHENIDRTLNLLEHVLGFYHVAEEVEPTIREGPSDALEAYLDSMAKLQKAQEYFNANNSHSPEMAHVATLFEAGKDALEREFRNLLARHSKPVQPVVLLDAVSVDDDLPSEDGVVIEHMPQKIVTELQQISHWLQNCGMESDYMDLYASIRSTAITKSLQGLKDHMRSGSQDSANVSFSHSPVTASKLKSIRDTPTKKGHKGIQLLVKKASIQILKQQMIMQEVAKKSMSATAEGREEVSERDIEVYATSVSALLKLMQSEQQLMKDIIPEHRKRMIFEQLVHQALDIVIKEGEHIVQNAKKAVGRNDFSAVICIFPVGKHLRAVRPDYEETLEGCRPPIRQRLPSLISAYDITGAKALQEYIDGIRNDPDKSSNMPRDGTVHELTSNTLLFMEQLQEFAETAGAMLMSQDPSVPTAMLKSESKARLKLAEYITKVLSALGLNLSNKAETYSDVTLRSVFMLNNYNYIVKTLKRCGMLDLVHRWNPEVNSYYNDQVLEQKRIYSQSWSRVLNYVLEAQKPISQQRTASAETSKLKDKERQIIKDKFTGFNQEMEHIVRIQKSYSIPDPELREQMKQDNKEFVIPKYEIFLEKYRAMNFTKNPEKYMKYTVHQVADLIDSFFESAA